MATYVATATQYEFTPGSTTGFVASVPTPSGSSNGDTIFFIVSMATSKKGSVVANSGQVQVGSWVDGESDAYGAVSISLWKVTHDGSTTFYDFTFNKDTTRGGCIIAVSYSGDCTVQQISTATATSASGARSGPAIGPATGNNVLAFFGGSAVGNAGVTWNNSFVERADGEYYGLLSLGEIAGDGTSKTPNLTPVDPSQSMWIVLNVGPTSGLTLDSCLPDADVVTTGWSTAPLFSKVNDSSDATVITATAV